MTCVRHCASSVSDLNPAAFTASICQAAPSLPQRHFLEGSTDVKLFIEEEDIGMNTSTREEVQKYEGGPSLSNASATAPTAEKQDPTNVYAAAKKLADVIKGANVEDINSTIETLACQTDSFAIFNFRGLLRGSLLHIAAATGNRDILRLLLSYVDANLIATRDDWGNTPLHIATKAKAFEVADMLIRRARDLSIGEDKNWILRIKNNHGNTALHEAVLTRDVGLVRHLLGEDLEPVYWENEDKKSPLYLALDTGNSDILRVLLSPSLDPSRIEGLPLALGAVARKQYAISTAQVATAITATASLWPPRSAAKLLSSLIAAMDEPRLKLKVVEQQTTFGDAEKRSAMDGFSVYGKVVELFTGSYGLAKTRAQNF